MVENIQKLVELNNQFYGTPTLSFALGAATGQPGERMEDTVNAADQQMYASKKGYYANRRHDRRKA